MYSLAHGPCCAVRLSPSSSAGTVRDLSVNVSCGFLDSEMLDSEMIFEKKVPNIYAKHCPFQAASCFKAPLVHPGGHQVPILQEEHALLLVFPGIMGERLVRTGGASGSLRREKRGVYSYMKMSANGR